MLFPFTRESIQIENSYRRNLRTPTQIIHMLFPFTRESIQIEKAKVSSARVMKPILDSKPKGVVRCEIEMLWFQVIQRRCALPRLHSLTDCPPFIGHPISTHLRIMHYVLQAKTEEEEKHQVPCHYHIQPYPFPS